jgi:large subunit ribosomal protein L19
MNTDLLLKIEKPHLKKVPDIAVGDQVEVHTLVREKNRTRVQIFKGLIIAIKGSGIRKTFTVRKISMGVGVEKIFPLHSPNIQKIVITRKGNVSRSKLYYLRERIGKRALKVKVSENAVLEDFYAQSDEIEEVSPTEEKGEEVEIKSEEVVEEQTTADEKEQTEDSK